MDEQKRPRAWVYARIPGDYDGTMNSYKVCSMQALHDGCDIVGGSIDERGGWLLRPGYRDKVYICSDIETDAAEVQEKLRQAELAAQEERNEVKQDEQRRRSSRSDGAGSLTGYRSSH